MWQSPPYTIAPEGGSISITCSTREPLFGVYLKQSRWPEPDNVVYYEDGKEPTVDERFTGRVTFSGAQHNLTVSMHRLQPADTGTYVCQTIGKDEAWGPGTLVVVTGRGSNHPETTPPTSPPHLPESFLPAPACLLQGAPWIAPYFRAPSCPESRRHWWTP